MPTNIVFSVLALAGIAVLWRNLREDLPAIDKVLNKLPWAFRKSAKCGYCSTMWITFVFLLFFHPLGTWIPQNSLPMALIPPVTFFLHWMILGFSAVALRFGYVLWQERVHDLVHARGPHVH